MDPSNRLPFEAALRIDDLHPAKESQPSGAAQPFMNADHPIGAPAPNAALKPVDPSKLEKAGVGNKSIIAGVAALSPIVGACVAVLSPILAVMGFGAFVGGVALKGNAPGAIVGAFVMLGLCTAFLAKTIAALAAIIVAPLFLATPAGWALLGVGLALIAIGLIIKAVNKRREETQQQITSQVAQPQQVVGNTVKVIEHQDSLKVDKGGDKKPLKSILVVKNESGEAAGNRKADESHALAGHKVKTGGKKRVSFEKTTPQESEKLEGEELASKMKALEEQAKEIAAASNLKDKGDFTYL